MYPHIHIGQWSLSSYMLLYGLALMAAGGMAFVRLVRGGMAPGPAGWSVLLVIWAAFAGAMGLMTLIGSSISWLREGVWSWQNNNAYIGGLLSGLAAAAWAFHHNKLPLLYAFDRLIVAIPLGQAIGRIGCFLTGCCYGQISHSWLAFPQPDRQGAWLPRYPSQLISAVANLLILAILLLLERWGRQRERTAKRGLFDGALFWSYLGLYALKRFSTDFIRGDAQHVWGPLSTMHYITAGLFLIAVTCMVIGVRRSRIR